MTILVGVAEVAALIIGARGRDGAERVLLALGAGLVVAGAALTASRLQLASGGPGLLAVTVPVPAILLFTVALVTAVITRSFGAGLANGALALAASFAAVFCVVAVEGFVWMERRGVFVLDGDAPAHPVGAGDIVLDLFSTGMWLGHLVFWLPWPVLGAALGARIGTRESTGFGAARCRPGSVRPRALHRRA